MIRAQGVLESGMRRPRVYHVREAQLPHVAQPLERLGVEQPQEGPLDADVVPKRVAEGRQGLLGRGVFLWSYILLPDLLLRAVAVNRAAIRRKNCGEHLP